ncbi:MAG: methyltransferase domain-containing protein [Hyphomicrobiaceae bacterium]|nr:methyltransferase domain-containing protein [Hyphomicrobiaceae bacterium]
MHLDIHTLRDFYQRPLGGIVRRMLGGRIRARWRNVRSCSIIGLGYATPYLGTFREEAGCIGALMPATQGAMVWPSQGACRTVMVEEATLPLADASVDRLLCVHCLEMSENAGALLREMWRVLTPEGRILVVVPNRRGIWARFDTTPFGFGRPYSLGQLEALLKQSLFTPVDQASALHMPPMHQEWLLRWATAFERLGGRLWPAFSGVQIVEARKELMGAMPRGQVARARRKLVTLPAPMRRTGMPSAEREDA